MSHDDQQTPLDSINREVPAERSFAGERLRDQLSLVIIVRLFWGVPGYFVAWRMQIQARRGAAPKSRSHSSRFPRNPRSHACCQLRRADKWWRLPLLVSDFVCALTRFARAWAFVGSARSCVASPLEAES